MIFYAGTMSIEAAELDQQSSTPNEHSTYKGKHRAF